MTHTTLWSHDLELPAEVGSAARARAFVTQHLVDHRLPHLVDDVRLAASELATNAVVHARTDFTVLLQGRRHSVLLTVRDGSSAAPAPLDVCPPTSGSGRGLAIVERLSQTWGVRALEGGTKSVWASFGTRRPVVGQR